LSHNRGWGEEHAWYSKWHWTSYRDFGNKIN
jgi:hypothetical protein